MENNMTKKKMEALAAAYAAEINLWDDPFDAPSVPDESLLKEFVENAETVETDLADQIRRDLNCRRALDRVKFEKYGIIKSENMISEEDFHKMLESLPAAENKLVLDKNLGKKTYFPRKGDIFYTQSKLPVVDENGGTSFVYTFKPCAVLLLDDGEKMPWNDKVFRCAVVTPDYMGKAVEGQDMDLKNGWILHKWLSYPVSIYQLDCTKKMETVKDIDDIAEIVEEYSVSDEGMTRYGKDEKRLMAMAEYVPVTADTRFAAFEMSEEASESVVSRVKNWLNGFTAKWVENLRPSFAPAPSFSLAADEDKSRVVVRRCTGESEYFTARLKGEININANNCKKLEDENWLPMWIVDEKAAVPDGTVFTLIDVRSGKSIGYGEITGNAASLEHIDPDALLNAVSSASQVILEVFVW